MQSAECKVEKGKGEMAKDGGGETNRQGRQDRQGSERSRRERQDRRVLTIQKSGIKYEQLRVRNKQFLTRVAHLTRPPASPRIRPMLETVSFPSLTEDRDTGNVPLFPRYE